MRSSNWYKHCCFIFIGLWLGILIMSLRITITFENLIYSFHYGRFMNEKNVTDSLNTIQKRIKNPLFIQTDLYKLPYQLDYPLNFKRTPRYARLPYQPPCRSFGEWLMSACHNNSSDNYIDFTLIDLLKVLNPAEEYIELKSRFLINGGAHDGMTLDPLYPLFIEFRYPGLAIEVSTELYKTLKLNLPADNIIKLNVPLEPHTVHQLFVDNQIPFRPLIMKMDIDGYDYAVVRSIFIHLSNNSRTEYYPAIVLVEMNEKFPPPIHFYTRYRSHYSNKGDHFYGASITAWTYLLSYELGYVLLGIYDWNNLIYLRYDLAQQFNLLYQFPHNSYDVWAHGYWNRPQRDKKFPWNDNVKHWYNRNTTLLTKYRYMQKYLHSTKTFIYNKECSYFMDIQPIYIESE